MECCKNKKDKRIDKLVLLIEDLNKQQKAIVEYIEKLEEVIKNQKK